MEWSLNKDYVLMVHLWEYTNINVYVFGCEIIIFQRNIELGGGMSAFTWFKKCQEFMYVHLCVYWEDTTLWVHLEVMSKFYSEAA